LHHPKEATRKNSFDENAFENLIGFRNFCQTDAWRSRPGRRSREGREAMEEEGVTLAREKGKGNADHGREPRIGEAGRESPEAPSPSDRLLSSN
jgi:hypothetical protein